MRSRLNTPVRWMVIAVIVMTSFSLSRVAARADDSAVCLDPAAAGCMSGLPTFQYQQLLGQMLAHPSPNVRQVEVDESDLDKYAFARILGGATTLYDGPGGGAVGSIDPGFNYVTPLKKSGDWTEILTGRWVPNSVLSYVTASHYSGVLLDGPLAYPMAWMLLPTKPSATPGQKPDKATPLIDRYTRLNIFATVKVGDWEWYLVGPGQWVEQRRVARLIPAQKPDGVKGRWVAVDLYEQTLIAYEDDQMIFATLISSGLPKWSTNEGLFRIWARAGATTMSGAMGQSDFYYLQAVPWVMYFDQSISLHGTYWHDGFGYRHSHGCVNMSITDAHWIYDWTQGFFADTWVSVWSSGTYVE
ncbi:MAG TPA: L,D-transpeptidase [Aggregatilineales bacterium]|nr:L,D-transpeptidase [Aggregatilineales bacterium]